MSQLRHADVEIYKIYCNMFHMRHKQTDFKQLGTVIAHTCKELKITQNDLSLQSGIPRNSLNRKIHGGGFTFDELIRIATVLDIPLSKLIQQAEQAESALAGKDKQ